MASLDVFDEQSVRFAFRIVGAGRCGPRVMLYSGSRLRELLGVLGVGQCAIRLASDLAIVWRQEPQTPARVRVARR